MQTVRLTRLSAAAVMAGRFAIGSVAPAFADQTLLNVSYDPTRELYKDFTAAFAAKGALALALTAFAAAATPKRDR